MKPQYQASDFPEPGSVVLAPLGDGRWGAGVVLRNEIFTGSQAVLVRVCDWIGDQPPALDSPKLRSTLILNHHSFKDSPEIFWTRHLLPEGYLVHGQIELTESDLATESTASTGWQSISIQVLQQWRWETDREALLREEAEAAARFAETRRVQAAKRQEMLKTLTLATLASKEWLADWQSHAAGSSVESCRETLSQAVEQLRAAEKLTPGVVKKIMKAAIERLNRLNDESPFITTTEREDLCEAIEQILCAAKHPQLIDPIDRMRTW